jgi:Protein of unknown function (DUF2851)
VTEAFLHYIWQFQYFDKKDLVTTEGETITILKTGFYNTHAGPDFSQAKIKIGELEWIGHVEIHIHASEWQQHKHHHDKAYDNVVLHVVWKNDKVITRSDGSQVPTLELKNRIEDSLLLNYKNLVNQPASIPCAHALHSVNSIIRISALDRALAQRLENKAQVILKALHENNNDWEETFYQLLGKNFGFKVNSEAFYTLTKAIPYRSLLKHSDKLLQLEAMLLGTAGFLDKVKDDYAQSLQREYQLLQSKFDLAKKQLNESQWRFLRLRPANFPTLRIAQFATLLSFRKNLFSTILATESIAALKQLFDILQSDYWQTHYRFDKKSKKPVPGLGEAAIENIIINTVVPTMAAYSIYKDENTWMDRAVDLLSKVSPEKNSIISEWKSLGWSVSSAFDSQALIELRNNFCHKRLCLQCTIGHTLIRKT